MTLEKTFESPLDCKEIKPVNPDGNQSWILIVRTDAEAEAPILWPPHAKSWLIGKDPDAGKDWRQEEKGTTEGEMIGWHHWHEFEPAPGDGEVQGSLVAAVHEATKTQTRLSYWKTNKIGLSLPFSSIISMECWGIGKIEIGRPGLQPFTASMNYVVSQATSQTSLGNNFLLCKRRVWTRDL